MRIRYHWVLKAVRILSLPCLCPVLDVEAIMWLNPHSMSVRHIVKTQHIIRLRHATLATDVRSAPVPCQIRAHIFFARNLGNESYLVITTDTRKKAHLEYSSFGRGTRQQVVGCERVGNDTEAPLHLPELHSVKCWTPGAGDSALYVYISYLSSACSYVKSPYTRAG